MTQPIQMHRPANGNSRNYRWCICGAPWVNGRCGRVASPPPIPPAAAAVPAQRPALQWGPFSMAIVATVILGGALVWAAAVVAALGGFWAALGATVLLFLAFMVAVVFVASGVVALRRGR
jgi:hypothetical protein